MKRAILIALTGSIGMGKSTTAQFFADAGARIWDADAAVHRLYAKGGAAVASIKSIFPAAIIDGAIDRAALKSWIADDKSALKQIEAIVHPLVAQDREDFIAALASDDIAVFDIPLLFELNSQDRFDFTVVATTSADIQRARVLARPNMTTDQFERILTLQLPDAYKRSRADFIIPTDTLEAAEKAVKDVLTQIKKQATHA